MNKTIAAVLAGALWTGGLSALAGEGYPMKCGAEPAKDPATGQAVKPCGYETKVTFGGGMLMQQVTGYCRNCRKFVYLHWTRQGLPEGLRAHAESKPAPKPLGEIWDPASGTTLTTYACPHCKGPFAEIRNVKELTHCPACGQAGFGIDRTKPMIAVD